MRKMLGCFGTALFGFMSGLPMARDHVPPLLKLI